MSAEETIQAVVCKMQAHLDNDDLIVLENVLRSELQYLQEDRPADNVYENNYRLLSLFLSAKSVEGCSKKTLRYYDSTIRLALEKVGKPVTRITADDLRGYLNSYHYSHGAKAVTIDNVRRILSSFFAWLEDEDHIVKSPVRRIHKVRSCRPVKQTYSDEDLVRLCDYCKEPRDLAIVNLLASTGMRVGELVGLNCGDVDLEHRECLVLGKGNKERVVYFDAVSKIHLKNYLASRRDDSEALFVSLNQPVRRLEISGVEDRLRTIGRGLGIEHVHPHKFRRTFATRAIDKGMPIEQVQKLLGHQSVDTTLMYAMVDQSNVRSSHRRYIC
jgi:site-specific recombinase XerD